MTYTYPVDPADLFLERTAFFVSLGVPAPEVERLSKAIDDMWADRPGGWCYEWSRLAARYAESDQPLMAARAYGIARFPCLADASRSVAHQRQLEQYVLAAEDFPVSFERRIVTARVGSRIVEVPVHVLSEPGATDDTPVVLASGGIDTWKTDLHDMWVALVRGAHVRIVAFDIPGTGELTDVPLTPASTEIVDGMVAYARTLTTGKVGQLGVSFGGYFSAHAGLTQVVDAAVDIGGPVLHSFEADQIQALIYGMRDVFGNAAGFTAVPSLDQLVEVAGRFPMTDLLDRDTNSPMFVINGDEDVHVPAADTRIFEGRKDTDVELIPGGTHCAANKFDQVVTATTSWLSTALHRA
jgi:esterase FrsA